MNRIALTFAVVLSIATAAATRTHAEEQPSVMTLAVMNLDDNDVPVSMTRWVSDLLRHYISQIITHDKYTRSGKTQYILLERAQMERIFDEFELYGTGCFTDSCAIEMGRMLQADRIIVGRVSYTGASYVLSARLVDVETGKQIQSSVRIFQSKNTAQSSIIEVAEELMGTKIHYTKIVTDLTTSIKNAATEAAHNINLPQPSETPSYCQSEILYYYGSIAYVGDSFIKTKNYTGRTKRRINKKFEVHGITYMLNRDTSSIEFGLFLTNLKYSNNIRFLKLDYQYHPVIYGYYVPYVSLGMSFAYLEKTKVKWRSGPAFGLGLWIPYSQYLQIRINYSISTMHDYFKHVSQTTQTSSHANVQMITATISVFPLIDGLLTAQ